MNWIQRNKQGCPESCTLATQTSSQHIRQPAASRANGCQYQTRGEDTVAEQANGTRQQNRKTGYAQNVTRGRMNGKILTRMYFLSKLPVAVGVSFNQKLASFATNVIVNSKRGKNAEQQRDRQQHPQARTPNCALLGSDVSLNGWHMAIITD